MKWSLLFTLCCCSSAFCQEHGCKPLPWPCPDYKTMLVDHDGVNLVQAFKCLEYEKFLSPVEAQDLTEPMTIGFEIDIKAMTALDTSSEELGLDFVFKMTWVDGRLAWPDECYEVTASYDIDKIYWKPFWIPNIYIEDIVSVSVVRELQESLTLELSNDGTVTYGGRYLLKKRCRLAFVWFPLDTHECDVVISLYHDTTVANITVDGDLRDLIDPEDLELPDFYVDLEQSEITEVVYDSDDDGKELKYSTFQMTFRFTRIYSNHLLHTYIPSFMLCTLSACSVFIPSDLIPGRMSLCITTFLSIISLFNGAKSVWPTTSYMKAADLWTLFCYIGVFYSLAEYCLILYLTKKSDWEAALEQSKMVVPFDGDSKLFDKKENNDLESNKKKRIVLASKIERFSRFGVPLYFILFVLLYWIICLS